MTEQEKYGMDRLSEYLEMQIRIKDGKIKKYKEQIDSDYLYYFAWAGKDLFKEHYMAEKYKEFHKIVKEAKGPDEVHDYLREKREKSLGTLLNGEIYSHYSDEIFNLAHSYKMECTRQLLHDYNGFGQLLSMKPPREEANVKKEPETKKKSDGLKI